MAFVSGYIIVASVALCLPIALLRVIIEIPVLWKLLMCLRVILCGNAFIGSQFLGAYVANVEVKK